MGILHLLDEECALQKGSDETLATKLREKHSKHDYFDAPKREQLCFTVKHYAGDVTYLCTGFRERRIRTLCTPILPESCNHRASSLLAASLRILRGLQEGQQLRRRPHPQRHPARGRRGRAVRAANRRIE